MFLGVIFYIGGKKKEFNYNQPAQQKVKFLSLMLVARVNEKISVRIASRSGGEDGDI